MSFSKYWKVSQLVEATLLSGIFLHPCFAVTPELHFKLKGLLCAYNRSLHINACNYAHQWIQWSIDNGTITSDTNLDWVKQDSQGWSTNETGASPLDKVAIVWDEHHRRWALNSIEIRLLEWEQCPCTRPNPSSTGESGASHLETPIKVYAPSSSNAGV